MRRRTNSPPTPPADAIRRCRRPIVPRPWCPRVSLDERGVVHEEVTEFVGDREPVALRRVHHTRIDGDTVLGSDDDRTGDTASRRDGVSIPDGSTEIGGDRLECVSWVEGQDHSDLPCKALDRGLRCLRGSQPMTDCGRRDGHGCSSSRCGGGIRLSKPNGRRSDL